jgi:hypothetical protein
VIGAWAGDDGPLRPEISPLFGSSADLRHVLVFTGTRDTIHPQDVQIANQARMPAPELRNRVNPRGGRDASTCTGPGLLHSLDCGERVSRLLW